MRMLNSVAGTPPPDAEKPTIQEDQFISKHLQAESAYEWVASSQWSTLKITQNIIWKHVCWPKYGNFGYWYYLNLLLDLPFELFVSVAIPSDSKQNTGVQTALRTESNYSPMNVDWFQGSTKQVGRKSISLYLWDSFYWPLLQKNEIMISDDTFKIHQLCAIWRRN